MIHVQMTNRTWILAAPLVLGIGFFAVNPTRLYAILGAGDVVFDPSAYATLGKIWKDGTSTLNQITQTYNQTVKIAQNAIATYNLGVQMAQRVQNKNVWMMAGFAAGNELTESHYNEQINFNAVMNGDVLHAATAWHQSTLAAGNAGYLANSSATTSNRMAKYSTIQLLDQTSQRCAMILANYKTMQDTNKAAEDKLFTDTFDSSDAKTRW
jgi:hypothetical protein